MDAAIETALALTDDAPFAQRVVDITTRGARSQQLRRIEIWFHNVDGEVYITGTPGARSWYANLLAHPEFTFHLKHEVRADLPVTATATRLASRWISRMRPRARRTRRSLPA
ncbi:hypothetical protein J2Y46_001651 [Microbacterium sp. BE35]|uniref:nitroreductase/quinone reductase family protein n=1 Tax=Microbacterium sp. BE35 TaxID=2817773 RepID=UPI00286685FC|nr:nitroreductase/quinone reductase family protein [Microbacterium sp. BE35]MDR7188828.1 hypothetical protein [Microbacterium sp. BE35]